MKRWLGVFLALIGLGIIPLVFSPASAQQPGSAPTLVPPTLVPTLDPGAGDVLPSESAIARVQRDGVVRVGILYNAPPFGTLNIRGEVSGFDADLARKVAETWGVKIEFTQVTRQTAVDALKTGQVDMLVGAQVHRRELDADIEFSQTPIVGSQSMMVRADDATTVLAQLSNRKVAVVIGTPAVEAVNAWLQRTKLPVTVQTYLTLDQAFVALVNKETDGVVESRIRLTNNISQPALIKILEEPVAPEPYAIAFRRQDVNLRDLINRTLQYLVQNKTVEKIYQTSFPGLTYPTDSYVLWANIGDDAPKPSQYQTDIAFPAQYAVPRIMSAKVIRVAGVSTLPEDAPESQRRFELLNRTLIEKMAARWGVQVQYIPDSAANALDLVASGQADVAVGTQPDWNAVDKVDFSEPYLLHGERLLVPKNSAFQTFADLRGGKTVGILTSEPEMRDQAVNIANSVNARIEIFLTREQDVALTILNDKNADVVFGDSLKLIPQVQANPDLLQLTKRAPANTAAWYSRSYVTFAVPRNDIDFRLLVNYTLQEIIRDGTLNTLLQPVMLADEIPAWEIWPGPSSYLGLSLAASS
jgi:polar amino acid transport system substrate-binding protein